MMQSLLLGRSRCSAVDRAAELVDGELEPQLVRLVDDDEQQFVIGIRHRALRRQQLVDFQI